MNLMRWIFAIPLAFGIMVLLVLLTDIKAVENLGYRNLYFYAFYHITAGTINIGLFVSLASLFAPSNKKYAALVAVLIMSFILLIGWYFNITNQYQFGINIYTVINTFGIIAGLSIGFYVSLVVFKNKGWSIPKITQAAVEEY